MAQDPFAFYCLTWVYNTTPRRNVHAKSLWSSVSLLKNTTKYTAVHDWPWGIVAEPLPLVDTTKSSGVWVAAVRAADGTPWEGIWYPVVIEHTQNFPFAGPYVRFAAPMFHPHVGPDGSICCDNFTTDWSPALSSAENILLTVQTILSDPFPNVNANPMAKIDSKSELRDRVLMHANVPGVVVPGFEQMIAFVSAPTGSIYSFVCACGDYGVLRKILRCLV